MPNLSIVILNYKNYQYTKRCVASIFEFTKNINFEIIVINNSPEEQDFLADALKDFENVSIIKPGYNTLFARGVNLGVSHAKYDYLALVNNDGYFQDNSLLKMLDFLQQNAEYTGVTGNIIEDNPQKILTIRGGKAPNIWTEITRTTFIGRIIRVLNIYPKYYRDYLMLDWDRANVSADIQVGCNAYFVMRNDDFIKIGMYNPDLFFYYSEEDYFQKIKKLGKKIRFMHDVRFIHDWGDSTKKSPSAKILAFFLHDRYVYFSTYYNVGVGILIAFVSYIGNPYMIINTFGVISWLWKFRKPMSNRS